MPTASAASNLTSDPVPGIVSSHPKSWPIQCGFILTVEACVVGCFDLLTKAHMRAANKEKAGVGVAAAAGIASCVLGATVSFPLEVVARRLQVSPSPQRAHAAAYFFEHL